MEAGGVRAGGGGLCKVEFSKVLQMDYYAQGPAGISKVEFLACWFSSPPPFFFFIFNLASLYESPQPLDALTPPPPAHALLPPFVSPHLSLSYF